MRRGQSVACWQDWLARSISADTSAISFFFFFALVCTSHSLGKKLRHVYHTAMLPSPHIARRWRGFRSCWWRVDICHIFQRFHWCASLCLLWSLVWSPWSRPSSCPWNLFSIFLSSFQVCQNDNQRALIFPAYLSGDICHYHLGRCRSLYSGPQRQHSACMIFLSHLLETQSCLQICTSHWSHLLWSPAGGSERPRSGFSFFQQWRAESRWRNLRCTGGGCRKTEERAFFLSACFYSIKMITDYKLLVKK